jgi:hypothetical protein
MDVPELLGSTHSILVVVVSIFEPKGMNMPRQITQQRQANVDQQIRSTSMNKKHPKGRNENLQSDGSSGEITVMRTTQIAERTMIAIPN